MIQIKAMLSLLVQRIGVLRTILSFITLLLVILAPFAVGETQFSGLGMIPTLLAPALAPMLVFVYPLDMTMSAIYMADTSDAVEKQRHKYIIRLDSILLVLLVIAWLPFFYQLLNVR